jgi:signal peptidase I
MLKSRILQTAAEQKVASQEKESALESIGSLVCTIVPLLFALTFVFENMVIPSASMASTILVGDHVIVDRASLAPRSGLLGRMLPYRDLRRGEPVVFKKPILEPDGTNINMIKRVVGIPGDRIHLRDGIVYLNGIAQDEPQAASRPHSIAMRIATTSLRLRPITSPASPQPGHLTCPRTFKTAIWLSLPTATS